MIVVRDFGHGASQARRPTLVTETEVKTFFDALLMGHEDAPILWDRDMTDTPLGAVSIGISRWHFGLIEVGLDHGGFCRFISHPIFHGWIVVRRGREPHTTTPEFQELMGRIEYRRVQSAVDPRK